MNIIQQSFHINIRILEILGFYPSKTHPVLQKIKCYVLYFFLMVIVILSMVFKMVVRENRNIIQMNLMTIYMSDSTGFCFKLFPFVLYGERIQQCMNFFGHSRFLGGNEEEKKIIGDCVKICRTISVWYFWLLTFSLVYWVLPPALESTLPLDVWLPFDPYGSIWYYPMFIYLSTASIYTAFAGAMVDPLIGGLAYHATTQLKVLKYKLQHLHKFKKCTEHCKTSLSFKCVSQHLKQCIMHHNSILDFVTEYENCFSFCLLSQIVGCLFGVCFCCIGLIVSTRTFTTIQDVVYGLTVSIQIFFYCYFGTILFEENSDFINTIYMGKWYTYDVQIRKTLVLMMERSKQPMMVHAGKIVDLSLNTFASMLKTSYSLIAVFNNY